MRIWFILLHFFLSIWNVTVNEKIVACNININISEYISRLSDQKKILWLFVGEKKIKRKTVENNCDVNEII